MTQLLTELSLRDVAIDDDFWKPRLKINRNHSLIYQWEKYEEAGTVDNFRIAGGLKEGKRRGYFYVDSDLHKWADAVSRFLAAGRDAKSAKLLNEYITLVEAAMDEDGYLYTFNQVHFPGTRWVNLQIEHELYSMGHFIEAGVEHFLATGGRELLQIVEKTADLICRDFADVNASRTPGHEEIELALLRLYRITGREQYRKTAENFLEMRGRKRFLSFQLLKEFRSHQARMKEVSRQLGGEETEGFDYTETTGDDEPFMMGLRLGAAFMSGRYQQQHKPLSRQKRPAGHAVRWAYLQTARAMAAAETGNETDLQRQEKLWEALADGWMYVTGGTGSLPLIEGFGRKYELNNRYAYCETCAAIGSVFWNHELSRLTGNPRYADQLEWQLYNAASVGISSGGDAWFYRNPLDSAGDIQRRPWFDTACCPSNVSRLQASLGRYIALWRENELVINQYISCGTVKSPAGHSFAVESSLPFGNRVKITARAARKEDLRILFRVPSWADGGKVFIRGMKTRYLGALPQSPFGSAFFEASRYESITVPAGKKITVEIEFSMPVRLLQMNRGVRAARGRIAVSRGPLVYCLEEYRNRGMSHDAAYLLPSELNYREEKDGTGLIIGRDKGGPDLFFTPYHDWGNRGTGWMQVWVRGGS